MGSYDARMVPEVAPRRVASVQLGGQRVDLLTRDDLVTHIIESLRQSGPPLLLASANLDHINQFSDQSLLFEPSEAGTWLVLLDGMPLVRVARRRTGVPWEQLAGSDLLPEVLTIAEREQVRVGFVGGTPELHTKLEGVLSARWPGLVLAGHWIPSRSDLEDATTSSRLVEEIRLARVDFLVVGLGKPRQEVWLGRHAAAAGIRVGCAFGAAADFLAGDVPRAPDVLRRLGLEWAYRLAREPRRLARRYLVDGPFALARVLFK